MSKLLLKFSPVLVSALYSFPLTVLAQDVAAPTTLSAVFDQLRSLLNWIIILLFILATVIFLWGVVKFIMAADNPTERDKAKAIMTWGIIGLAVMTAVWGIVTVIVEFFDLGGTDIPGGPDVPDVTI